MTQHEISGNVYDNTLVKEVPIQAPIFFNQLVDLDIKTVALEQRRLSGFGLTRQHVPRSAIPIVAAGYVRLECSQSATERCAQFDVRGVLQEVGTGGFFLLGF